jgi:hypothetical protein
MICRYERGGRGRSEGTEESGEEECGEQVTMKASLSFYCPLV